ncbi:MAG: hypothetical protein PVF47_03985 [Anaerolineae bacterium]|jgi:hypothetical protein
MKSLADATQAILSQPTPEALVELQGSLLASGRTGPEIDRALDAAGHFYTYLSDLQSKVSARNYSELASLLDIGAVGAVALENVISAQSHDFWQRLILGGLGESLMVAASRQYIKGWEIEAGLVHSQAAWYLAGALWHASGETRSDLSAETRWQAIHQLLAPARDPDLPAPAKALLLGRIFQMLLLTYLARLLSDS